MNVVLVLIPLLPLVAVFLSLLAMGKRFPLAVTVTAGALAFLLAIAEALRVVAKHKAVAIPGWVELDGLGATLLLLVTFLSATAALFSWGYMSPHGHQPARIRSYCAHFNLFVFSLMLVPVLAQPAFVWIAIEFTSLFSVLLVAFDNTQAALEAAWKYALISSDHHLTPGGQDRHAQRYFAPVARMFLRGQRCGWLPRVYIYAPVRLSGEVPMKCEASQAYHLGGLFIGHTTPPSTLCGCPIEIRASSPGTDLGRHGRTNAGLTIDYQAE